MTKTDLEPIKQKLQMQRDLVLETLRRVSEEMRSDVDDTTRDAADLASASHDKDVLYRLKESYFNQLKLINEVLDRIDQDGYGTCEQCGNEISKARLAAIPWATSCLSCQEQTDLCESSQEDSPFAHVGAQEYGGALVDERQ